MSNNEDFLTAFSDQPALQQDKQFIVNALKEIYAEYTKVSSLKITLSAANDTKSVITGMQQLDQTVKTVTQSATQFKNVMSSGVADGSVASLTRTIKLLNDAKYGLQANSEVQKQLTKDVKAGVISADEYRLKITELTQAQYKYKNIISDTSKEIKDQMKLNYATPNSVTQARLQNRQLTTVRNNTNENDTARIAELNALIDRNNQLIERNADAYLKRKINVGNYNESAQLIVNALEQEKIKLQNLTTQYQSFANSTDSSRNVIQGFARGSQDTQIKMAALDTQIKETQRNIQSLTNITKQPSFETLAVKAGDAKAEVATLTKALIELERDGLGNTAPAAKLRQEIISLNSTITSTKAGLKDTSNESNALTTGAGKAWGAIRKLAYILPSVGIGTIVAFITEPIIKWISSVKEATGDVKILQDVQAAGAKDAGERVALLEIERSKLTDLTKSSGERTKIATEYNKVAAEGNKISLDELNNITLINAQIDKQIGLVEKQALAKAAQSKIAEYADKAIAAEFKLQEALEQTGLTEEQVSKQIEKNAKKQDDIIKKRSQSLDNGGANKILLDPALAKNVNGQLDDAIKVDGKLTLLLTQKRLRADELNRVIKLLKPDLADSAFDGTGGNGSETQRKLTEALDKSFEIYKIDQQRKIDLLQKGAENEKNDYDQRINYLNQFSTERLNLIARENEEEKRQVQTKLVNDIANLEKEKKKGADIKGITAEIAIVTKNAGQQLKVIDKKTADDRLKIFDDNEQKFTDILKQENEKRAALVVAEDKKEIDDLTKTLNNRKAVIEGSYSDEVQVLNRRFTSGGISEEQYNSARLKLDKKHKQDLLAEEIQTTCVFFLPAASMFQLNMRSSPN